MRIFQPALRSRIDSSKTSTYEAAASKCRLDPMHVQHQNIGNAPER